MRAQGESLVVVLVIGPVAGRLHDHDGRIRDFGGWMGNVH